MFYIGKGRKDLRTAHWNDIRNRVRTHEGEILTGLEGKRYQEKWSKKMLGRDLNTKPVDVRDVEKFEATKK